MGIWNLVLQKNKNLYNNSGWKCFSSQKWNKLNVVGNYNRMFCKVIPISSSSIQFNNGTTVTSICRSISYLSCFGFTKSKYFHQSVAKQWSFNGSISNKLKGKYERLLFLESPFIQQILITCSNEWSIRILKLTSISKHYLTVHYQNVP